MSNHHHSHTRHSIDYYTYISGMKNWNSSFKVVFALLSLIAVLVCDNIYVSVFSAVYMCFLICGAGKIPVMEYFRMVKIPLAFIFMSTVAILIQISGDDSNAIDIDGLFRLSILIGGIYFYASADSVILAVSVGLKAIGAVSCMYMLTLSTPVGSIISVLKKAHVPSLILELMHLIYRYIFIMLDVYNKQRDAAQSRLGYVDFKTSLRTFSATLSNLLVMSLKRADDCYDAMESRGYDGELMFLEDKYNVRISHILFMTAFFLAVIIIEVVTGYGQ